MSEDPSRAAGDLSPTETVLQALQLDRNSPIPLWFQMAQGMQDLIVSGAVPSGSRLENEVLFSRRLKVSRPTVRRAMEHLVDSGLIVRRRGVGTRVVQPKVHRPLALSSLYDDLLKSGQQPTTRVLSHHVIGADPQVATALELQEGDEVVELVRLRSAGEQPIARLTNFLPVSLVRFSLEAVENGGLYQFLRGEGITLHAATQTIGARRATAEEARLLQEPRGAALLTMQRTAYDDLGRPIEHGTHIYASSRYSIDVQLLAAQ